jgi:hypothetical protein
MLFHNTGSYGGCKWQFIGIHRVGATLAVALKNRGIAPAAKGDRKGRPYACISNNPINCN